MNGSGQDKGRGDIAPVLDGIRAAIERLSAVPMLRDDPVCTNLLARMATAEGARMEVFHALVETLEARVAVLASGDAPKAPRFEPARPTRRPRTLLKL